MIDTGDLRKGLTVEIDGTLYNIVDWEHNKTGRGGAKVRLTLRDVRAGHIIEQTYDSGAKFQRARVEREPAQYLYSEDDLYYFMNRETYDQMVVRVQAQMAANANDVVAVQFGGNVVVWMDNSATSSGNGCSTGTSDAMRLTCRKDCPSVRGMCGLTSAMMSSAFSTAALTMSTDTPRLTYPWRSGGLT